MSDPEITDVFQKSGYEAGLAGLPLTKADRWSEAWEIPGTNFPAYVIAGWIAGQAVHLFRRAMTS